MCSISIFHKLNVFVFLSVYTLCDIFYNIHIHIRKSLYMYVFVRMSVCLCMFRMIFIVLAFDFNYKNGTIICIHIRKKPKKKNTHKIPENYALKILLKYQLPSFCRASGELDTVHKLTSNHSFVRVPVLVIVLEFTFMSYSYLYLDLYYYSFCTRTGSSTCALI